MRGTLLTTPPLIHLIIERALDEGIIQLHQTKLHSEVCDLSGVMLAQFKTFLKCSEKFIFTPDTS